MLVKVGIIMDSDVEVIWEGLFMVLLEIDCGSFNFFMVLEDIYMNVEVCLKEIIGEFVGCLYMGWLCND